MCGRFTLIVEGEVIEKKFKVNTNGIVITPRYNIAPGQDVMMITGTSPLRELSLVRWGLIPSWAKDAGIGYKMINARAETLAEKPAFRQSYNYRRCLIPADSFFEWKQINQDKIPMRINLPEKPVFAFAGLWDRWKSPQGSLIQSCTIITVAANHFMQGIHYRMPAILADEDKQRAWLENDQPAVLDSLLVPYTGEMGAYRVSKIVNNPNNDIPECIGQE